MSKIEDVARAWAKAWRDWADVDISYYDGGDPFHPAYHLARIAYEKAKVELLAAIKEESASPEEADAKRE